MSLRVSARVQNNPKPAWFRRATTAVACRSPEVRGCVDHVPRIDRCTYDMIRYDRTHQPGISDVNDYKKQRNAQVESKAAIYLRGHVCVIFHT